MIKHHLRCLIHMHQFYHHEIQHFHLEITGILSSSSAVDVSISSTTSSSSFVGTMKNKQMFICVIHVVVHFSQHFSKLVDKKKKGGKMASWFNSALDSGSSGPGSSPGWGHCVVFLGKTLTCNSHSASLHPGV